ncbi:MAG: N-acetylmuramoyl-L-alanine amidase, partial [Cyclonatronaceae bacterium]
MKLISAGFPALFSILLLSTVLSAQNSTDDEYRFLYFSAAQSLTGGGDSFQYSDDGRMSLATDIREATVMSDPVAIPIDNPDPFIAISAVWTARSSDHHLLVLQMRTSPDGNSWGEWINADVDHHVEPVREDQFHSQLLFFSRDSRFVQYRVTMSRSMFNTAPQLDDVTLHFINPGVTNEDDLAVIESKSTENRQPLRFTPSVKTDESIPNYLEVQDVIPLPDYVDRETWGQPLGLTNRAVPEGYNPTPTLVTHLVVHHSASDNDSNDFAAVVRAYYSFHVNSNGWADIGYNWLVDKNGVIYQGRVSTQSGNPDVIGAHASGNNSNTMGIVVIGNYNNTVPSDNARIGLHEMLAWKANDRNIDPLTSSVKSGSGAPLPHIGGHRDYGSTDCPGNSFYPQLPSVRIAVDAILKGEVIADKYYIPQGENDKGFSSLADAVTWLNSNNLAGPTEFRITADLDETGADIVFDRNDLSNFRSLTIRPDDGVSPVIRVRQLHFFATKFITIDGGGSRALTLLLDDEEVQQAIYIEGSSRDITIRNTNITWENRSATASAIQLRRVDSGPGFGAPSAIRILNNRIGDDDHRFYDGMLTLGSTDMRIQLEARNNEIFATRRGFTDWFTTGSTYSVNRVHSGAEAGIWISESADGIYSGNILHADRGVHLFGSARPRIDNNVITGDIMGIDVSGAGPDRVIHNNSILLTGASAFVGQYTGINLAGASESTRIEGNTIIARNAHPTSGGNLRGIALGNNNTGGVWIANNMISFQLGNDGNAGSRGLFGISHSGVFGVTAQYHIAHNSILIGENNGTGVQAAVGTTVTNNPAVYTFLNNLLLNRKTGGNAYALYWNAGESGSGSLSSDFNNLYASGGSVTFQGGNTYPGLVEWQAAKGQDASSVSKNVTFVADDDLRLDGESVEDADLFGTAVPVITEDIDGNLRNPNTPQMGAHEAIAAGPAEFILVEGFE